MQSCTKCYQGLLVLKLSSLSGLNSQQHFDQLIFYSIRRQSSTNFLLLLK